VEGYVIDDARIVKVGSCPQVECLRAILDSDTRHNRMGARSLQGPPRVFWIM
jgi:hypothetical protein